MADSHHNRIQAAFDQSNPGIARHIVGVGLDASDGHTRLTRADSFSIVGGSEGTHERMTETLIKTTEDLERRGKSVSSVDPRELCELLHKNTPRK